MNRIYFGKNRRHNNLSDKLLSFQQLSCIALEQ